VRLPLQQFSNIFEIRDTAGRPYILIGGQAVNYWAERYLAVEPSLQQFLPFTSADIDFRGNRDDVRHIAAQLDATPVYPPKVAITALAGVIPIRIGKTKSNVEIVRHVPGVTAAAIEALAVQAEWEGRHIRVLEPISLLAGKLELALTISQTERQDVQHVHILIYCVRGFLRELLVGVERNELPVKGWLGAVNRTLKLTTSSRGRKAARQMEVDWRETLPLKEIEHSSQPKVRAFAAQQLSRWLSS